VIVLFPSARVLTPEQRDLLVKAVAGRFRWVTWTVIILLLISGLYNVRQFYWEEACGPAWAFLTIKIALAGVVFLISLCLTLPLKVFDPFRQRRRRWLTIAFILALIVILISAYLRLGSHA